MNAQLSLPEPSSIRCDDAEHPDCGGPLYLWMLRTTNDYWPVIRCENHLRLQDLWTDYLVEWSAAHKPWGFPKNENDSRLGFKEWLRQHWAEDTSSGDIGPHWELITPDAQFALYFCGNCGEWVGIICKGVVEVHIPPKEIWTYPEGRNT